MQDIVGRSETRSLRDVSADLPKYARMSFVIDSDRVIHSMGMNRMA